MGREFQAGPARGQWREFQATRLSQFSKAVISDYQAEQRFLGHPGVATQLILNVHADVLYLGQTALLQTQAQPAHVVKAEA